MWFVDIHYGFEEMDALSVISIICRYYKTKGVLPPTWKYESSTASALVS